MKDIIIIGAGPVGLYASTLASLHKLDGIVIEGLDQVGGQLTNLYPEKDIVDLPGFEKITAAEFISKLVKQNDARENKLPIHTEEKVESFKAIDDYYRITTNKGEYDTKTILICSGMGVFQPRKTGLENEDKFSNIIYSLKSKDEYKGKEIVILGGGDSAVDWSIMLSSIASKVSIVHRRDEFRAQSASVDKMISLGVDVYKPYGLYSLNGDDKANSITLKHNVTNELLTIPCDAIFVNYGIVSTPCNFTLSLKNNAYEVDSTCQTSMNNIFAIGNAIYYEGKVKNITSGLGEAVIAISKIDQIIHPGKNIPIHF